MQKLDHQEQPRTEVFESSRRARLEALLCTGAMLGTTLLAPETTTVPKIPPYVGE